MNYYWICKKSVKKSSGRVPESHEKFNSKLNGKITFSNNSQSNFKIFVSLLASLSFLSLLQLLKVDRCGMIKTNKACQLKRNRSLKEHSSAPMINGTWIREFSLVNWRPVRTETNDKKHKQNSVKFVIIRLFPLARNSLKAVSRSAPRYEVPSGPWPETHGRLGLIYAASTLFPFATWQFGLACLEPLF